MLDELRKDSQLGGGGGILSGNTRPLDNDQLYTEPKRKQYLIPLPNGKVFYCFTSDPPIAIMCSICLSKLHLTLSMGRRGN